MNTGKSFLFFLYFKMIITAVELAVMSEISKFIEQVFFKELILHWRTGCDFFLDNCVNTKLFIKSDEFYLKPLKSDFQCTVKISMGIVFTSTS